MLMEMEMLDVEEIRGGDSWFWAHNQSTSNSFSHTSYQNSLDNKSVVKWTITGSTGSGNLEIGYSPNGPTSSGGPSVSARRTVLTPAQAGNEMHKAGERDLNYFTTTMRNW
jgi:hypothetical protein